MSVDKYDFIAHSLTQTAYTREQLYDHIYRFFPAYSANSCNWVIGVLVERNLLHPLGNSCFCKAKEPWSFNLEKSVDRIRQKLIDEFPLSDIAIIDSKLVNELSNMDGGEDFILIEISKRDLFPCYMRIRELTKRDVLLTPTEHELSYYLKPGSIILKPLFSKSPCRADGLFSLEKLLVDLYCNKTFLSLYQGVDFEPSLKMLLDTKNVNLITCINYAKRRKCISGPSGLIKASVPDEVWALVGGEKNV